MLRIYLVSLLTAVLGARTHFESVSVQHVGHPVSKPQHMLLNGSQQRTPGRAVVKPTFPLYLPD
jgi:hypothetical protein